MGERQWAIVCSYGLAKQAQRLSSAYERSRNRVDLPVWARNCFLLGGVVVLSLVVHAERKMIESPESGEPSGLWSRLAHEHLRSPWVMLGSLLTLLGLIALMLAGRSISSAPAVLTAGVILLPVLFAVYAVPWEYSR